MLRIPDIKTSLLQTLLLIFFSCLATASAAAEAPRQRIEQAVLSARAGDYALAIQELERLRAEFPGDRRVVYDLAVVYAWNQQYTQAIAAAEGVAMAQAPAYVVEAVAKAARGAGRFDLALRYYRLLLERSPGHKEALLGLAYSYADSGDWRAAQQPLAQLQERYPDDLSVLLGRAYVARLGGQTYQAMSRYLQVLADHPHNRDALQGAYWSAVRVGAFAAAARLMQQAPDAFSQDQQAQLTQWLAATHLRWGAQPFVDQQQRYREIDWALTELERLKGDAGWQALEIADKKQRALAHDALVALQARQRNEECIVLYRSLAATDEEIPAYALSAVGLALLEAGRPEQAKTLFEQLRRQDNKRYQYNEGLFYSLSDIEEFASAAALIDEVAAAEPPLIATFDGRGKIPNPTRLSADIASAYADAYRDDLQTAQQQMQQFSDAAPHNHRLRADLGTLFRWRGWPRRAEQELALAAAYQREDESVDTRIQQAHGYLDRTWVAAARPAIDRLNATYPEKRAVERLAQRWTTFNARELLMNYTQGRSSGAQFGTRHWTLDSYLFDRRNDSGSRWYLHNFHSDAELEQGDVQYNLQTLGYQWVGDGLTLNVEAGKGLAGSNETVASARADWWLDDHWNLGAELQFTSRATPLRAIDNDIDSDSLDLSLNYRWSELRSAGTGVNSARFDDGNDRHGLFGFYRQRLYNSAVYKLTGEVGASYSANSQADSPYFNPDEDRTLYLQLENEWRVYRRADHSFHHRLYLTLGDYYQQGFGSGELWRWRYEHDWEIGLPFRLVYGISRGRAVYDGDAEFEDSFYLTLNWRF